MGLVTCRAPRRVRGGTARLAPARRVDTFFYEGSWPSRHARTFRDGAHGGTSRDEARSPGGAASVRRAGDQGPYYQRLHLAYFVDIAGEKLDKARRYGRRFALATVALDETSDERAHRSSRVILSAVRDTDVMARVDEQEFYAHAETGGRSPELSQAGPRVGGRTRGRRGVGGDLPAGLTIGVAEYPHDGTDLVATPPRAKRPRAEMSRGSVVRTSTSKAGTLQPRQELMVRKPAGHFRAELRRGSPHRPSLREAVDVAISAVPKRCAEADLRRRRPSPRLGLSYGSRHLGHEREDLSLHILDLRAAEGCEDLQVLT